MTTTASRIWLDGHLVETSAAGARAPLMGHALQRGSLVFDVGSFHRSSRGPALFRAPEHVARLVRSAEIVGLPLAYGKDELLDAARAVVAASGLEAGLVRWSVFYGAGEPDLLPRDLSTRVAVAAQAIDDIGERPPIAVASFDDARKAAPDVLPADAKAAAAYLGPLLARRRAIAAGADEIVLLDRDGDIAEAPTANAFAVAGGVLWTPPLGRVLPGITRDTVLTLAREAGVAREVKEAPLPRAAFAAADEAFLCGTSLPIAPIGRIDDRTLAAPGPITQRLLSLVNRAHHGELPEHASWLMFVRSAG
jgi:branched-chain amino acid aminotransferase